MTSFITQLIIFMIVFLLLYYLNRTYKNRAILFINLLFLSESLFLILFFYGYINLLFPFLLLCMCIYYLVNYDFTYSKDLFAPNIEHLLFPLGFFVIILTLILELFFFDSQLSNNSVISLLFGFSLVLNGKNLLDKWIGNFALVFFTFLFLFFPVSAFLSKLIYKDSTYSYGLLNDSEVVELLLVKPVLFFLSIISLNAWNIDNRIFFEDLEYNMVSSVEIAESCSGIYSVIFYLSAFFSFYILEERNKHFIDVLFLFFGIIIAYFANILRMVLLILIGHFYGIDKLLWSHENIGWVIFLLWTFGFWYLYSLVIYELYTKEHDI